MAELLIETELWLLRV